MRILIHVGNPKTGSSSLQQYLYSHREQLQEVGACYPDFGHRAHWILTKAFTKKGDRRTVKRFASKGQSTVDELQEQCTNLVANYSGELLIFSNEGLSHEPRAGKVVDHFRSIRPDAEIIVLDYIRDPLAHFPSATQQNLKAEGDYTLFPAHWLSTHCVRAAYLQRAVGENLILRVFSPEVLVNGDVVDDFIAFVKSHFGIDLPPNTDKQPRNSSYSGAGCAILALRDLAPHAPLGQEDRKKLGKPLRATDDALKPEKLKLTERFRQAITANNHVAWNRLIDATDYGVEVRERLKLPEAVMPVDVDKENTSLWVIQSLTEEFVLTLLDNIKTMVPGNSAKRLGLWLTCAVNETADLHGITIGEKDPAAIKKLARQQRKRDAREAEAAESGDARARARLSSRSQRTAEEKAIRKAERQRERERAAAE